ncbi:uncharacterized protein LOC119284882 isoform X2 [Triticum dicoccoides]|uniref:uncharacterized protein LOC119284882 isoform X2 n=1 Tax=Triticum dicoccoides TaxID=85692 RepID=UPI00189094BC|nr:uncharacterized protein LOC119284882 isoform X2 [Triticum dicoccoides]
MGGYTWFGLGTMLISEGARLKGSRFSNSLYAYCMLMVSWMRVEEVEEAAELAWRARAFITQPFVMEPVVVFILVICLGLAHPCRPTEGPWLKEVEKNLVEITSHGQMKWTLHYSRSLLSITTMAIMPRMNGSPMSIVLL